LRQQRLGFGEVRSQPKVSAASTLRAQVDGGANLVTFAIQALGQPVS